MGLSGRKGRIFYSCAVFEVDMGVVAIGSSILAKSIWKRSFGTREICKKIRWEVVERALGRHALSLESGHPVDRFRNAP